MQVPALGSQRIAFARRQPAQPRDLRSRLRHHYTDKAKRTEKKYADMPVEDYKTLMKAQFDSCDENKDGRLDFAEFEKFCLAGVKIAGKDEKQLLAFFNAT